MTITEAVSIAPIILGGLSVFCSALSAVVPDPRLGIFAKFVNLLALNVGRATNDPRLQGVNRQDALSTAPVGQDSQG
jgi:hypothetical protein